jgi:hypothetical protein
MRAWRFITLLLTALTMGMTFCHVLEMPVKMSYDGPLYVTLQNEPPGLYLLFGTVGAFIEVGAILSAALLSFLVRKQTAVFYWPLVGAICLGTSLVVWLVFIALANTEMSAWTATSIPTDWTQWRNQWEFSHAASFVLHLLGFGALLFSTLLETPSRSGAPRLVRRRSLTTTAGEDGVSTADEASRGRGEERSRSMRDTDGRS